MFAVLRGADPEVMDRDELAGLAKQLAAHRAWCDSLQVRITRRQRALAEQGRAESPADLLAREGSQSGRDARTADDREQVCSNLPNFEAALASGAVSAGHVDAIAAVVRGMDQVTAAEFFTHRDDLLAKAGQQSVDSFGRGCRDLARLVVAEQAAGSELSELERQRAASKISRWTDKATGMRKTLLELDPERDKIFWTAVSASLKKLRQRREHAKTPWAQLEVESLLAACNGGTGTQRVPALFVLADIDTLRTGCTPTRSAKPTTAHPCPSRSCADSPATPRSSPSSSTVAAKP